MNCHEIEPLLSEYIDNTLSARQTWEVDRHLAECNLCTHAANALRKTVALLSDAPTYDLSVDFMAKLQSRLAEVETNQPMPSFLQNWRTNLAEMFRPRVRPVWGLGLATCVLATVLAVQFVPRSLPAVDSPRVAVVVEPVKRVTVRQAASQNIAIEASDPFGDTAAANLAAHATNESAADNGAADTSENTGV